MGLAHKLSILVFTFLLCNRAFFISSASPTTSSPNSNKLMLDLDQVDWENLPLEAFLPLYGRHIGTSTTTSTNNEQQQLQQQDQQQLQQQQYLRSPVASTEKNSFALDFLRIVQKATGFSLEKYSVYSSYFSSTLTTKSIAIPNVAPSTTSSVLPHRTLQTKGTNCILIERGKVPRYYDCNGCVIDRAQGCIDDLRLNKSLNVHTDCPMMAASVRYLSSCCPRVTMDKLTGRYDLQYVTAGYAMALRCLKQVGCGDSVIHYQLERECKRTCPLADPRNGESVCYSDFNSGFTTSLTFQSFSAQISAVLIVTVILANYASLLSI